MIKVYLDNNIFISFEERGLDFNVFKNYFQEDVTFVYSNVHIQEMLEANIEVHNILEKRINTITEITKNQYLTGFGNKFEISIDDPKQVISLIKHYSVIFNEFRTVAKEFNIDREKFIGALNVNKLGINNCSSKDVVNHINLLLSKHGISGFEYIVNLAGTTLHEQINSIFNFLDVIGYWKDKQNEKSDLARMYDAGHAYLASGCDYFISNDKRACNKTKVAYELYEIDTKVLSVKELESLDRIQF